MMNVVLDKGCLTRLSSGEYVYLNNNILCAEVNSFKEASEACKKYIEDENLGASTFTGGEIYKDGVLIARVSYNGRVWDLHDNEIDV